MSESNESLTQADTFVHTEARHIPTRFWNVYETEGSVTAMLYLATEFEFDAGNVRDYIPAIMKEGVNRGITMVEFYQEFLDAVRTTNDGGGIPSDSSGQAVRDADEDVASEARDADVEDQGGREECSEGEDLSK